jgi:hypothetical protein
MVILFGATRPARRRERAGQEIREMVHRAFSAAEESA